MIEEFRQRFGSAEGLRVFRAPGRVNLIDEHTDYNLGLVLPMAIERATFVGRTPARDRKLRIYSEARREVREWEVASIGETPPSRTWTDYVIGVARELLDLGYAIESANLFLRSTVPEGAGLSSSAALEVSCALALLNGKALPKAQLAQLCRRAEMGYVGVPCGIMDQFVAVFGKPHRAIELDCRSLDHRLVTLPAHARLVAVNSMIKHDLAASAYRQRVAECAAAVEGIQRRFPHVESLRDVTLEQLAAVEASLDRVIAGRARHVISENLRVRRFAAACEHHELTGMGRMLVESHRSLQHDYEVSSEELDYLVDTACAINGVYGARMMGGGFGGCVLVLVTEQTAESFAGEIAEAYEQRFGMHPEIYTCEAAGGAEEVNNFETIPKLA